MPTYTYQCDNGHRYDAFESMSADPQTVCQECGGKVQRVFGGGAGIVFKGSGFYVTDYRKKSGGESKSSDSSGSGSSGGGDGGSSSTSSTSGSSSAKSSE